MHSQLESLRERLAEIEDIAQAGHIASWDQHTQMPPRGAPQRAEVLATLEKLAHERFVAAETGRLLDGADAELSRDGRDGIDDDDVALVRETRRRWEKARRVPTELAADMARASSLGQEIWARARASSDYALFAPVLERHLALKSRYIECFDAGDSPYDVLLDDYEPGMPTAEVTRLFGELRDGLVPLIARLRDQEHDHRLVHLHVPVDAQRRLVDEVIALQGWNAEGWRIDDSVHPFQTSFGATDVRITDRWEEDYFPTSLFGAMHETGHGLYEAGIAPELMRTPLGHGVSLGVHESQSRMWENMVGRGRPFAEQLAPRLARLFGGEFSGVDADAVFRAVNHVAPSLIRVEADEATYGLHVIIRFELEQELITGRVNVADLPEAWNARYREYLGIEVPDDAHGVLQDVHWGAGMLGYFSTYALGNLIAGQLWAQAHRELGDLDDQLAAGQLGGLRTWLGEKIHRHGAKYRTDVLLERVVGSGIEVAPFLDYLRAKLSAVYALDLG